MDDLIKICDELERCRKGKICYKNEVVCAKSIVKKYVCNDYNKLLKIKAELEIHKNFESDTLNNLSLLVSVISLIVTIIYNASTEESLIRQATSYSLFLVIIFLIVLIIIQFYQKMTSPRNKWKKYISVVVDDMAQELKKDVE